MKECFPGTQVSADVQPYLSVQRVAEQQPHVHGRNIQCTAAEQVTRERCKARGHRVDDDKPASRFVKHIAMPKICMDPTRRHRPVQHRHVVRRYAQLWQRTGFRTATPCSGHKGRPMHVDKQAGQLLEYTGVANEPNKGCGKIDPLIDNRFVREIQTVWLRGRDAVYLVTYFLHHQDTLPIRVHAITVVFAKFGVLHSVPALRRKRFT